VNLAGHYWTLTPTLRAALAPPAVPAAEPWSTTLIDPVRGEIRVTGAFHPLTEARRALVLVHGLGGSIDSGYMRRAALAAWRRGWSVLRLNLRGSDGSGEDLYHAGLTADLEAALASPELAPFESVAVWGFSLGAHVALRWAATGARDPGMPRPARAVAVCAPLDLDRSASAIDTPRAALYRHYILRNLRRLIAAVEARGVAVPPAAALRSVRTLRQWDNLVVAPRFGFASAEDYYAKASVAPLLGRIELPTLFIHSLGDPMIPPRVWQPALANAPASMDARITPRGGHVGFPQNLDLGLGTRLGLEEQVLDWLGR